ncbi:MAG: twin-arginine translocation signal domain-containing protein, partial [Planctomycetota bacterium]
MSLPNRRDFLARSAAAAALGLTSLSKTSAADQMTPSSSDLSSRPNRMAVSTYSFWRFREDSKLPVEDCIDQAAIMGFDGVELLHIQMTDESNPYL